MRITWDRSADAAYVHLTADELSPGRNTLVCPTPDGVATDVLVDWKDGRVVGLEFLHASTVLHGDLLDGAELQE